MRVCQCACLWSCVGGCARERVRACVQQYVCVFVCVCVLVSSCVYVCEGKRMPWHCTLQNTEQMCGKIYPPTNISKGMQKKESIKRAHTHTRVRAHTHTHKQTHARAPTHTHLSVFVFFFFLQCQHFLAGGQNTGRESNCRSLFPSCATCPWYVIERVYAYV